jgi:uncharacterized protein YbcC (UPF0753/DUF2309 family)
VSTATANLAAERVKVRSDVMLAARLLPPLYPIDTFIAINPLGGLEEQPFFDAIQRAHDLIGLQGTLTEGAFRAAYEQGRITDADLTAALHRDVPQLRHLPPVSVGSHMLSAVALLVWDLTEGPVPETPVDGSGEEPVWWESNAAVVDVQTTKWCAAFLDEGQAAIGMPGRELGFYRAWRDLAWRDRTLPAAIRSLLRGVAERPDDALNEALDKLSVQPAHRRDYLRSQLLALPGWAGHVKWRADHDPGFDLVSYLAMRVSYQAAVAGKTRPAMAQLENIDVSARERMTARRRALQLASQLPHGPLSDDQIADATDVLDQLTPSDRRRIWQDAYESHYRDQLLEQLATHRPPSTVGRPAAQLVCCIDARSEGLRRHLEGNSGYDTLGFAGFFAVAIRFQSLAGGAPSNLCPVLLSPRNSVIEQSLDSSDGQRHITGLAALAGAEGSFHAAKDDFVGPFALAEAAGWVAGPLAAAKTLLAGRYARLRSGLNRRAVPGAATVLNVDEAFSLAERCLFAEVALTMMGLSREFAPIVVLCGHGSTTENNPYAAALDCGACGGNRGGPNARTAAAILNGTDVRQHLATKGIVIPDDTWFVAAEHDTAIDQVRILDCHVIPRSHHEAVARLAADLATAGGALSAERCATLPGAPPRPSSAKASRHVHTRSSDWAQVFPEWGLANNAAFIVGPRSMTKGIDLKGRAFLHSYDAGIDPDGAALETILTAPLVVAQWINCQYYFSAVDPDTFGAGTKTIHNVVGGGIGVLAGHNGDLQTGLPLQSVSVGSQLIHEPIRLLAIVQAPLDRIDVLIERNTVLQHLFGNGWVALAARQAPNDPWQRHTSRGWQPWTTTKEHVSP